MLKICPDAWDWVEDEVINAHAKVWIRYTLTNTHTHVTPTPTPLHHTQAAFPALNGCRDRGVMASLWADVQLGMLDVQAGIPGKAKKTLGKECCIDRKVWRGNSRYARVLKTEATVVNWYYHLWLKVGVFD